MKVDSEFRQDAVNQALDDSTLARGLKLAELATSSIPDVIVTPWRRLPANPSGELIAEAVAELGPAIIKWSTDADVGFTPDQPRGAKPHQILRCRSPLNHEEAVAKADELARTRPNWAHSLILQEQLDVDRGCLLEADHGPSGVVLEFRADESRTLVRTRFGTSVRETIGDDTRLPGDSEMDRMLSQFQRITHDLPKSTSGWHLEGLVLDGLLYVLQLRPSPVDRPVGRPWDHQPEFGVSTYFNWGVFDEIATVTDERTLVAANPQVQITIRLHPRSDMEPEVIANLESGRRVILLNATGGSRITHEAHSLPPPAVRERFCSMRLADLETLVPGRKIRIASDGDLAGIGAA